MNESDIIQHLNDLLEDLGFPRVQNFEYNLGFKDYFLMDSLDYVEFIMKVEKAFNIVITDEAASEIKNFGQMVKHVQDLVSVRIVGYPSELAKRNPS